MPRKPIGEKPMTDAERQARHRATWAAKAPVIRTRRPADHRGRARRWHDAVAELAELQAQYAVWLETLPDSLQDGTTAEALRAVCDLDLTDLQAIDPPRGFGRDCPFPVPSAATHQTVRARRTPGDVSIRPKRRKASAGAFRRPSVMHFYSGAPMHVLSGAETCQHRIYRRGTITEL